MMDGDQEGERDREGRKEGRTEGRKEKVHRVAKPQKLKIREREELKKNI